MGFSLRFVSWGFSKSCLVIKHGARGERDVWFECFSCEEDPMHFGS